MNGIQFNWQIFTRADSQLEWASSNYQSYWARNIQITIGKRFLDCEGDMHNKTASKPLSLPFFRFVPERHNSPNNFSLMSHISLPATQKQKRTTKYRMSSCTLMQGKKWASWILRQDRTSNWIFIYPPCGSPLNFKNDITMLRSRIPTGFWTSSVKETPSRKSWPQRRRSPWLPSPVGGMALLPGIVYSPPFCVKGDLFLG